MKVVIYHNVARKCRGCGERIELRGGRWARASASGADPGTFCSKGRGGSHTDIFAAVEDGRRDGHQLVRVFECDYGRTETMTSGRDSGCVRFYFPGDPAGRYLGPDIPGLIAGQVIKVASGDYGLIRWERQLGSQYRDRSLRSVSPGDVIAVGDKPALFAVGRFREPVPFEQASPLNEVTTPEAGTIPWPRTCPDGGTCHHICQGSCFRVNLCGPLPGVYPGDAWPDEIKAANPASVGQWRM